MRSLSIDLHSESGRGAFRDLVTTSDVFIDGLRPGITRRLGIDYESLHELNAGIVTMSLSAYGEGGELGHKGGVDMVVQAMCGMMKAEGGEGDPVANTIAVIDMNTAVMSSLTITLALFERLRSGQGQRCWDALAATATYLQGGEITRFDGSPASPVGGVDFKGPGAYNRIYRARDGWVRIQAATEQQGAAALTASGLGVDPVVLGREPDRAIADALTGHEVSVIVQALNGADLPAVPVRTVNQVLREELLGLADFRAVRPSDDGRWICRPGKLASFSRTQRTGPLDPPGIGEHSTAVLTAAGLAPSDIERLIADGVVVQGGPMPHVIPTAYR